MNGCGVLAEEAEEKSRRIIAVELRRPLDARIGEGSGAGACRLRERFAPCAFPPAISSGVGYAPRIWSEMERVRGPSSSARMILCQVPRTNRPQHTDSRAFVPSKSARR